jgi:hypothetical protein
MDCNVDVARFPATDNPIAATASGHAARLQTMPTDRLTS